MGRVVDGSAPDITDVMQGDLPVERYRYPPGPAVRLPGHMHEEYQFNLNRGAAGGVHYRSAFHVVPSGQLAVVMPGEPHTPRDPDERTDFCTHLALYVPAEAVRSAAQALAPKTRGLPLFDEPVVRDRSLVDRFARLHAALCGPASTLERDVRLLDLLSDLVRRCAGVRATEGVLAPEHRAVRRARQYLDAHSGTNVSLAELSAVAQLSRYRLVRLFSRDVGLPPHAYQRQRRVELAKRLLLAGTPVSRAGHEAGFFDLSHFTRHFKRYVGVAPGAYVRADR